MEKISPANVFTPAIEIKQTARFAGREVELRNLAMALESDGTQIVIYGNRGIGKSSLARQLESLSRNESEITARLKVKPAKPFDYLPVYFACDDSVTSIPKLLLRLLSDDDALASWVPFRITTRETTGEVGGKLSVKVLSISGKASQSITESTQELETDIMSVFSNAMKNIVDSGVAKDGVLIIIDEFDRIKDRSGLASLLKTLGPQGTTFALVGVATTIQDLITEHESVARQLADGSVHVPPMSVEDMNEVFNKAEILLEGKISFGKEAREWIIGVAKGHPFYIHLIGKHALLKTIDKQQSVVSREAAIEALREIALKGSAPIQETAYKTAIGHSYFRECVLKEFSKVDSDEIHTTELYARIAKQFSMDSTTISVYVGQLASEKFGSVLQKTRERYYRFTDSLFKVYAAARPYQLKAGDQEDVS